METAEYARMDTAEARMWWYRALHARLLAALAGSAGPVLDAGCGTGGFLAALRAEQPHTAVCGVEWAAAAAARAAEKSDAMIVRGTVNALPFSPGSFGAVVSADVLCHAAVQPDAALAELWRVLRPGGRVVVNLPSYTWLMSSHDSHVHNARRYTAGALRRLLLQAGFVDIRTIYWNCLLLPVMVLHRKLLRDPASSDVAPFSPWLDAVFHRVTELERRYLPWAPAGGSILAIASRL